MQRSLAFKGNLKIGYFVKYLDWRFLAYFSYSQKLKNSFNYPPYAQTNAKSCFSRSHFLPSLKFSLPRKLSFLKSAFAKYLNLFVTKYLFCQIAIRKFATKGFQRSKRKMFSNCSVLPWFYNYFIIFEFFRHRYFNLGLFEPLHLMSRSFGNREIFIPVISENVAYTKKQLQLL